MNIRRRIDRLEALTPNTDLWPKFVIMFHGLTREEAMARAGATESDDLRFVHFVSVASQDV